MKNLAGSVKQGTARQNVPKKGIILSLFMQFIMQSICLQSLMESTSENKRTLPTCNSQPESWCDSHPIFLKMYHFMFHFMSSLVTWDVVILVLIILKTHVWLLDF